MLGPHPVLGGHDAGAEILLHGLASGALAPARLVLMPNRLHRAPARRLLREAWRGAACAAAWQGDYPRAARLHGAADTEMSVALEVGSITWSEPEQELREREQASLRRMMGDEAYEAGFRSGAKLSRSQGVDLALGREPAG